MLKKNIESALNSQIEYEAYASFLYLAMATWSDREGLSGCAEFLYRQSEEERDHMMRMVHYINEMGHHAIIPGINQPRIEYDSIQSLFQQVYESELKVTAQINALIDLCYKEDDHMTLNFMQWFVSEQREEEAMVRTILDKIKLVGTGPQHLYFIDQELQRINKAVQSTSNNQN